MPEDFENLNTNLQKRLISVCNICNGCLACANGDRNKIFAVKIKYEEKEYALCPDNYGCHNRETIDDNLATVLFTYHAAQEAYGSDWKKKLFVVKREAQKPSVENITFPSGFKVIEKNGEESPSPF